jgi:hypothetical protein
MTFSRHFLISALAVSLIGGLGACAGPAGSPGAPGATGATGATGGAPSYVAPIVVAPMGYNEQDPVVRRDHYGRIHYRDTDGRTYYEDRNGRHYQ